MKRPFNYPLCTLGECPRAGECLRYRAMTESEEERLTVLNPNLLAPTAEGCKHYASAQKVRYAKGMKKVMGMLPHSLHERAATALALHFSERSYYRIRKGERLLSPEEQKTVRQIISRMGFTSEWDFDAYVEDFHW